MSRDEKDRKKSRHEKVETKQVEIGPSRRDKERDERKKHRKHRKEETESEDSSTEEEVVQETESEDSEEEDVEQADSGSGSDDDEDEDAASLNTTDILSSDPLYFVLSRIFITKDGKNIATILEEINQKLGKTV
jgi:hypothetical protein